MKANKIARIKFMSPEFVYHKDRDGKRIWNMSSSDKKLLLKVLNQPSEDCNGVTIWQYTIMQYNLEAYDIPLKESLSGNHKGLPLDLPIPDYNKLVFESKKGNRLK